MICYIVPSHSCKVETEFPCLGALSSDQSSYWTTFMDLLTVCYGVMFQLCLPRCLTAPLAGALHTPSGIIWAPHSHGVGPTLTVCLIHWLYLVRILGLPCSRWEAKYALSCFCSICCGSGWWTRIIPCHNDDKPIFIKIQDTLIM